jgi:hypothetical protein
MNGKLWFVSTFWMALLAPALAAADTPSPRNGKDVRGLADQIDRRIEARWNLGVKPAPLSDDAEFHRRVSLDLNGRIPAVADVYAFLADRSPEKRQTLVDSLLAQPRYAEHFAHVWRAWMMPADNTAEVREFRLSLEAWLRHEFRQNVPFDRMVRALLTTPIASDSDEESPESGPSPAAFFQLNQMRPENLAASTSRVFLGTRLECAQCHDHPFARWKRQEFWEFAAFFAGIEAQRGGDGRILSVREAGNRRTLLIAGSDKEVSAQFLGGGAPRWTASLNTRAGLADWVTARDNPYFARAAVNRAWAHLFGVGLVDPIDDLRDENAASHPELLDDLARAFAAHEFDWKFLLRAIIASRTYQRSSAGSEVADVRQYTRVAVKGMSPEQLFDSVAQATGYREPARSGGQASAREAFLSRFTHAGEGRADQQQTSILQVLTLMNGKVTADATSVEHGPTLAAIAEAPWLDTEGRIQALYLAALSRKPRPEESARLVRYVDSGRPGHAPRKALADVLWALLNSSEFLFNH